MDEEDWEEEMNLDADDAAGGRNLRGSRPRPRSAAGSGGGSLFASRKPGTSSGPGTAAAAAPSAAPAVTKEPRRSASPEESNSGHATLEVALPVLNGMVYTEDCHSQEVLTPEGLGSLLPLLHDRVPFSLHEQATHVLFNATTSIKDPATLGIVVKEGCVEGLITAATIANRENAADGLALAFGTLCNLAEGCGEGRSRLVQSSKAMELVLGLCGSYAATPSDEVRCAAAELLLALTASAGVARDKVLALGGRGALEAIASARWSGDVISARAKQALRELS